MTEVQELVARLRLKDEMTGPLRKVRAGISGVSDALNSPRMQRGISQVGTGIKSAAVIASVGIGALASQVAIGLRSLADLEDQTAATNAAIKSTKGVAGITAEAVRSMAEEFENLNAIFDDKVIQSGENLILTFTNIRKEAFKPTLQAALDLSVAMDQDLNTSVLQLGKALNDPIRGLTALRRVGVQFSADQEKQIKTLVEHNDLLGAQKVILEELGKEFGGRFAAQGQTAKGTIAGIGDAVQDLQKALASSLFPTIKRLLPRLRELLTSSEFTQGAERIGKSISGLLSDENLKAGGEILREVFNTAKDAAPTIAAAARITGEVVKTAVSLFRSLPPEIQQLAIGAFAINKLTGGLVTNIAGGLISSVLKQLVSGVVNVQGAVVNVVGAPGVPGVPAAVPGTGGKGILGQIADALPKLGAAAGFGLLTQQTIQAAVEQGVIDGNGHLIAHYENGNLKLGAAIKGGSLDITKAVATAFPTLGAAINKASQEAELGARRVEAAENRSTSIIGTKIDASKAATDAAKRQNSVDTRAEAAGIRSAVLHKPPIKVVVNAAFGITLKETLKTQTTFKQISGNFIG